MGKLTKAAMEAVIKPASDPYEMGYDAGLHGPNLVNSHFSIFSTPEATREWERGKKAGDFAAGGIDKKEGFGGTNG